MIAKFRFHRGTVIREIPTRCLLRNVCALSEPTEPSIIEGCLELLLMAIAILFKLCCSQKDFLDGSGVAIL